MTAIPGRRSPRLLGGFRGRKVNTVSDVTPGEFETVDDTTQPGVLRQKLEQAIALLRQKDQEITTLKTAETQRTVESTWSELKVPDAIRKLYNGDTSADAIKAWWEDSKGLFNIQVAEEQPAAPELTPEQQAQHAAAQQVQDASAMGANAFHAGFETVQQQAKNAAEAYKNGTMSRADYDAAITKVYEATKTPAY